MRGFSLVELIVTLALLSILAIGSSRFLLDATDGYTATNERIQLSGFGATVLELAHRELSTALPLSTRVSNDGKCVEWIPVSAGGRYENAPIGNSAASFSVLGLTPQIGDRLSIPTSDIYSLGNPGGVSSPVVGTSATATDEILVTLSSMHQYSSGSPGNRIYAIRDPESFCFANSSLWHYRAYGFNSVQPGAGSLPSVLPDRILLAEDVDVAGSSFAQNAPSLSRNGLISVTLVLANRHANIQLERHINTRNVP